MGQNDIEPRRNLGTGSRAVLVALAKGSSVLTARPYKAAVVEPRGLVWSIPMD